MEDTFTLSGNVTVSVAEKSVVYSSDTTEVVLVAKDGRNPLLLLERLSPLLYQLGQITDEIAEAIHSIDGTTAVVEFPHFMLREVEDDKFIIGDDYTNHFLAVHVVEDSEPVENLCDILCVLEGQAPKIYNKVAQSAIYQVWTKLKKDYVAALTDSLAPKSEVGPEEGDDIIDDNNTVHFDDDLNPIPVNRIRHEGPNFGSNLDLSLEVLAGYVLGDEDLRVLLVEVEKVKVSEDSVLNLRKFSVHTSMAGDDVVELIVADPNDRTGTSVSFTHGDSTQPHGELGWTITNTFATGTSIEKEVRYL